MTGRFRGGSGPTVDALVVLGILALVLTLLDESFWTRDYLVAGLVPVVGLLALAFALRRLADGVWIYMVVALLAYAPVGALAALRRPGPWVVPAPETMNQVLGDTFVAPRLLVSTLPPVEASGTLMLLPYAVGYAAALPSAWLALATPRPVAPAVPLVAALAATIPVSVLVPDHYILRGVVIAVVLTTWTAARARRAESLVRDRRSGVAGTLAAVVVVSAVAGMVSVIVPDNDQTDRTLLNPAADEAVVRDVADSVVPPVGGRRELFRVIGAPEGASMRFGALDLYDGQAWVPSEQTPGAGAAGTFRRISGTIAPPRPGPEVEVRVRIRPAYAGSWLPTLGDLTSIDLDYRDGRSQLRDVRYNQATSSALVLGGVDPRDNYTFTSVLPPGGFTRTSATMRATEEQRQPAGAFLDQFLVPFDRAELEPVQRVLLLARYLRLNGAVRLTGPSSQEPIDLGLRMLGADRMSGTPFQYSAVTALGASRLGVPARVVVGARPGRRGVVRETDVYSWVELQLADGSWRVLEPHRYTGVHQRAQEEVDETTVGAAAWVAGALQPDGDRKVRVKIPKGADIELSPGAVIEPPSRPWRTAGLVALGLLALGLLAMLAVPGAKVLRRRRRRSAGGWSGPYVNGWQEVLDAARDRGTAVPETWSRLAQAQRLGAAADLARRADAAVFAPLPASPEEGRAFWDDCMSLRRTLLREAGLRHDWWAMFNPASLMAGWARRRRSARQVRDEDRGARRQQAAGA
ncbi:transglutaminase domain-containing protein [Nocardioides sp. zg-1230]|uniref:transglutaminase domain-containing protein n=1 Tax=Nocardioides sp. zg-1230 TaxID=2736601 RepID=UPI001557E8B3|nr:transglutaminase domain-containing protein [Nocardioides sp. zg-1230]NPC44306.1 transglutaminase domain-containing protein [Nocardioides sp. zg-1230]